MPSEPGSPELPSSSVSMPMSEFRERARRVLESHQGVFDRLATGPREGLTTEEQERIADGEPYCFRCGKPASSFPEYDDADGVYTRVEYVHNEEGTWNPNTNRFACDACYIAIGQPVGEPGNAYGWKAP